jgi:hypothetical protein
LRTLGLRVFLDADDLHLGDAWDDVLPAALQASRMTVVLVPSRTERRTNCRTCSSFSHEIAPSGDERLRKGHAKSRPCGRALDAPNRGP